MSTGTEMLKVGGYVVTTHGLRRADWPRLEAEGPPDASQVAQATRYLTDCWEPARSASRGSYGLKHRAESYEPNRINGARSYVSNGALIAAAVGLGFRVEPDTRSVPSAINADVYVKVKRQPMVEPEALLTPYLTGPDAPAEVAVFQLLKWMGPRPRSRKADDQRRTVALLTRLGWERCDNLRAGARWKPWRRPQSPRGP